MKYSVVHTGARDSYQVAAALSEVNSLGALYTSYYFKGGYQLFDFEKYMRAERRHSHFLDSEKVESCFAVDLARRVDKYFGGHRFSHLSEAALGARASRGSVDFDGVISYNYMAQHVFPRLRRGTRKILFQCHPNSAILDQSAIPGDHSGFELERELAWGPKYRRKLEAEWCGADLILAPSQFVMESLVAAGADERVIKLVPYGSPEDWEEGTGKMQSSHLRLLFVGQFVWRKGLDVLLDYMAKHAPPSVRLDIVGRGMIDPVLEKIASDLRNVVVHRNILDSQLRSLMQRSDIFVFPSRFEGYGLVINEALAAGTPVIGTRNTGLRDIIVNRSFDVGELMECVSAECLASKIESLAAPNRYNHCVNEAGRFTRMNSWSNFRHLLREAIGLNGHQEIQT